MKVAYIMRGLPGSGKTTIARAVAGSNGVIHSTDDYFYVDGEYRFVGEKVKEYHALNRQAFADSIARGKEIVVCDNTNVKNAHWEPYAKIAREAGYLVAVVTMPHPTLEEALARNTHNAPACDIRHMMDEWEN